ncbi:hypothetical protein C8Q70DRAFT_1045837 [Cubamyces menziesii]|uniref:MYND-type domain-containing protein n=1 Tax=Trametes cubensis TaxID=1111947 RepID=A0AAD7TNA7_9APHY|nr:hypothetical protein C8Q70DRAFT_1045837 [Cubamyces menziesii]KAJ8469963.1 hypothetical protein ONZ51_g8637 [Trametes cubensis]
MEPLTRSETLQALASMGIELPPHTRIPDEDLEKRLRLALDAAQEKNRFSDALKTLDLPQWPLIKADKIQSNSRPLLEAVRRGNWQEARQNQAAMALGASGAPAIFVDPFMDMRQTLMSLANALDNGFMWCLIQDPDLDVHAINIRFLRIYELDEKTPAMVLLYRPFNRSNAIEGARWAQRQAANNPQNVGGIGVNIKATLLEQKLLLKLLKMNAKLLPSDFTVERQPDEERFKVSVLLPLGPLGPEAIGKLNNNTGCIVCGKRAGMRCGQCQSASYCSAECQHADWQSHKQTCRSLKGGRWIPVPFRTAPPGMEGAYITTINRYTSITRTSDLMNSITQTDSTVAPLNIHGERPFLVKIQLTQTGYGRVRTMTVYDRQRSFGNVYIAQCDDPGSFDKLLSELTGPRGGFGGVKMYRWARRVGDWEFSVCLDRPPEADIKW